MSTPTSCRMPWRKLRSETLRLICKELGLSHFASKREEMCELLEEVDINGLEAVLKTMAGKKRKVRDDGGDEGSGPHVKGTRRTDPSPESGVGKRQSLQITSPDGAVARRARGVRAGSTLMEGVVITTSRRVRSGSTKKMGGLAKESGAQKRRASKRKIIPTLKAQALGGSVTGNGRAGKRSNAVAARRATAKRARR